MTDSGGTWGASPCPENTVIYRLFLPDKQTDIDELTHMAVRCSELAARLAEDHVWHYEPFRLWVCQPRDNVPAHILGSTCYRDNVEDEWLIVYILLEASQHLKQLVISISDDDGQFLLIEAAHHLPKWLKPDTAQNRVFLHHGSVHIIPKPHKLTETVQFPKTTPTLQQAIGLVSNPAVPTTASTDIQDAILHRVACYPSAIHTNLHHTHCYLPWKAAHVMSHDHQLTSAAVHALCDRGPEDMHAVRSMKHFSPKTQECIQAKVTLTRCLYAQLLHQRFSPPRNTGFTLPDSSSTNYKSCDVGMKLTCGLEMLVSVAGDEVSTAGGQRSDNVFDGPLWEQFVSALRSRGFFQGEVEGSQLYQRLMAAAQDYFTSSVLLQRGGGGGVREEEGRESDTINDDVGVYIHPLKEAGKKIVHILTFDPSSAEEVKHKFSNLSPPDNDEWLEISPEELDHMMRQAAGYQSSPDDPPASSSSSSSQPLQEIVSGVKSFVETVSSHKGAELPWSSENTSEVTFDPEAVLNSLRAMLGLREEEEEEEGSVGSEEEEEMVLLMEEMDRELSATAMGKTFENEEATIPGAPLDVDHNLACGLLASLSSQPEASGPASNMLHSLGITVPPHTAPQDGMETSKTE